MVVFLGFPWFPFKTTKHGCPHDRHPHILQEHWRLGSLPNAKSAGHGQKAERQRGAGSAGGEVRQRSRVQEGFCFLGVGCWGGAWGGVGLGWVGWGGVGWGAETAILEPNKHGAMIRRQKAFGCWNARRRFGLHFIDSAPFGRLPYRGWTQSGYIHIYIYIYVYQLMGYQSQSSWGVVHPKRMT